MVLQPAQAAKDLLAQKSPASLPEILRALVGAEQCEREVRAIQYRMKKARFPHHKDFASFDYTQSVVDPAILNTLSSGDFTRAAENILFIGGTGTGKTHLATALGCVLIEGGRKIRFFNVVDLINALIKEEAEGKAGRLQRQLLKMDALILDELGSGLCSLGRSQNRAGPKRFRVSFISSARCMRAHP